MTVSRSARFRWAAITTLLTASLLAAGCSSDKKDDASSSKASTEQGTTKEKESTDGGSSASGDEDGCAVLMKLVSQAEIETAIAGPIQDKQSDPSAAGGLGCKITTAEATTNSAGSKSQGQLSFSKSAIPIAETMASAADKKVDGLKNGSLANAAVTWTHGEFDYSVQLFELRKDDTPLGDEKNQRVINFAKMLDSKL
jgi:hypothetical protein